MEVRLSKKQKLALGLITKQPQSEAQTLRNVKSAAVLKAYQAEKKVQREAQNDVKSEEFKASTGVSIAKPKKWVRNPVVVPGRPPGGHEFIKNGDGCVHGPDGPPHRPMQPSAALVACEDDGLSFSDYMVARDEWHAWRDAKPKYTPPRTFIGESIRASYKGEQDPKVVRRAEVPDENGDSESLDDTVIQRKVKKVTKSVSALSKLDSKIAQLSSRATVENPYLALMLGRH